MPRKEASFRTLNKKIRHVLDQILCHELTKLPESLVVEKSLRIICPNTKPLKQKKRIKKASGTRWWSNHTETDELPPDWKAEVIHLTHHTENMGGGGGGKLLTLNCLRVIFN
jgi:hypothetical protein